MTNLKVRSRLGFVSVAIVAAVLLMPSSATASGSGKTCWYSPISVSAGGLSVSVPAACLSGTVVGQGWDIQAQKGYLQGFGSKCYYRFDFVDYKANTSTLGYHFYGHQYNNCTLFDVWQNSTSARTAPSTINRTCARYYVNTIRINEACLWVY